MALPVPEVNHLGRLPGFHRVKRVRVVVDVRDRLARDFDDGVAFLQARTVRWAAADHTAY